MLSQNGSEKKAQEKLHFLGDVQERGQAREEIPGQKEMKSRLPFRICFLPHQKSPGLFGFFKSH